MGKYIKTKASSLHLRPATFSDHNEKGIVFFIGRKSIALGAQCDNCHTVVWFDGARNPVINQRPPASVPVSGDDARKYMKQQWEVVLDNLPPCPNCSNDRFDRKVTNQSYQRWSSGKNFNFDEIHGEQNNLDPDTINVWWLEDTGPTSVFDKAWINFIDSKPSNEEE